MHNALHCNSRLSSVHCACFDEANFEFFWVCLRILWEKETAKFALHSIYIVFTKALFAAPARCQASAIYTVRVERDGPMQIKAN